MQETGGIECPHLHHHCPTYTPHKSVLTSYKSVLGPIVKRTFCFTIGPHHRLTWCCAGNVVWCPLLPWSIEDFEAPGHPTYCTFPPTACNLLQVGNLNAPLGLKMFSLNTSIKRLSSSLKSVNSHCVKNSQTIITLKGANIDIRVFYVQ